VTLVLACFTITLPSHEFFLLRVLKFKFRVPNLAPSRPADAQALPAQRFSLPTIGGKMNSLYFDVPLLSEIDQLQRQVDQLFGGGSSLRAERRGSFPALNIASTDKSVEIIAFVPGVNPADLEVTVDKSLLTLTGERPQPSLDAGAKRYAQERFAGKFRRTVELPNNIDSSKVDARYVDGCLRVSIAKEEPSSPKTISIQRGE
jgi:HSP20 family protein